MEELLHQYGQDLVRNAFVLRYIISSTMSDEKAPTDEEGVPLTVDEDEIDEHIQKRSAFSQTLAANGYHNVCVISRDTGREILQDNMMELIEYVKNESPESTEEVLDAFERDNELVMNDLTTLVRSGVVEYEDENAPPRVEFDHIVMEPFLTERTTAQKFEE